jgi:hypothetical protein
VRYEEWLAEVSDAIKYERCWQFYGYRKALFLYEIC